MIAERLPMRNPAKSSICRLMDYLTDAQKQRHRVEAVWTNNLESEDPKWAAQEMRAVQLMNTRCKTDKTYHLCISFPAGELPDLETLKRIESEICESLGYGEHQRVTVLHADTDNLHLHVAINKIHPQCFTSHTPYYDFTTLRKTAEQIEQKYRLQTIDHSTRGKPRETAATRMERAGDLESLIGFIQRNCLEKLKTSQTWDEFHSVLDEHGLSLKPRGNGLVFQSGDVVCKASSVDRGLSKPRLEKQLGEFQQAEAERLTARPVGNQREQKAPKRKYEKKPLKHGYDTSKLWEAYQKERADNRQSRKRQWAEVQRQRQEAWNRALDSARFKQGMMRLFGVKGRWRSFIIKAQLKRQSREIYKKFFVPRQPLLTWRQYLEQQAAAGNEDALRAIRARRRKEQKNPFNTISGNCEVKPNPLEIVKVTHSGNFVFEDGTRNRDKQFFFAGHLSDEDVKQGLMRALRHHNGSVEVQGDQAFKDKIVRLSLDPAMPAMYFKNPDMQQERMRQLAIRESQSRNRDRNPDFTLNR